MAGESLDDDVVLSMLMLVVQVSSEAMWEM